ncbi:copper resistance CopC family protein [Amycolatopsis kentuckyensis]|uniref:copper resistance CopC family protein n=1 Tax=Amycolatopsis kentuckyensis TaxID=218823 RepID=UPI000A3CA073|nr:copper resistance CopC family protein [Amycolatopsis kentuckyensis]
MTAVKERPRPAAQRPPGEAGRFVGLLLLVAACWGTLLALTPPATGDPVLVTTSPGSTEAVKSPDAVVLTFDRPVPAALATVRILDPDGSQVVFARPTHPDGREDTISVPMPAERHEGSYAVAWTLPSSRLEPVSGSFTFDVSYPIRPDGVPEIETTRDPVVAAVHLTARTLAVAAMVVLAGLAFFVAAIGPAAARARATRRLVKTAWWLVIGSTVAALVSFGPYAAWVPWRDALDPQLLAGAFESDAGGALLARLATLVPATLGLALLLKSTPAATGTDRGLRGAAVLGCASAVLATWTFADPRPPGGPSVPALAADIGLLLALAVPAGGLVLLRFPVARHRHTVARFARSVVGCAALLAVAGTAQAWSGHRLGWLPAGALAVAAILAVLAWLVPRRPAKERLGRRIVAVAGASVLITVATATLIALDPGQSAHAAGPAGQAPAAIRQQAAPARLAYDTGALDLVVIPAAGRLDVRVSVLGPHSAHTTVTAALGATPVPLDHAGNGYWTGQASAPVPGRSELALTLRAADGSTRTVKQAIDVR